MTKNIFVLLIAGLAGLFQAVAENVTKATMARVSVQDVGPAPSSRPIEFACQVYPDGTTGCCFGKEMPTLEWTPEKTNWKVICHRDPR